MEVEEGSDCGSRSERLGVEKEEEKSRQQRELNRRKSAVKELGLSALIKPPTQENKSTKNKVASNPIRRVSDEGEHWISALLQSTMLSRLRWRESALNVTTALLVSREALKPLMKLITDLSNPVKSGALGHIRDSLRFPCCCPADSPDDVVPRKEIADHPEIALPNEPRDLEMHPWPDRTIRLSPQLS